jgi:hypothetical protein
MLVTVSNLVERAFISSVFWEILVPKMELLVSAAELIDTLDFSAFDLDQRIEINDEQWQVSERGKLEPVKDTE